MFRRTISDTSDLNGCPETNVNERKRALMCSTYLRSISKAPVAGCAKFIYSDDFLADWKCSLNSGSPSSWRTRKKSNYYWQVTWTHRIPKLEKLVSWTKSQNSRAAMPWIGEVEDAWSIDDFITSASMTGRPIPDFENLDFKIASGLSKSQPGSFKKREEDI